MTQVPRPLGARFRSLLILLVLFGAFINFTEKSVRGFYVQGYQLMRAGEYKKGGIEFAKVLGYSPVSKLFRAGYEAIEDVASKFTSIFQPLNKFPWELLFALILIGLGVGMAIHIITMSGSYEFKFKWRIENREYTGTLACKDEDELRRHIATKGGEVVEVLQKIKIMTKKPVGGWAEPPPSQDAKFVHYAAQTQDAEMKKCPYCSESIKPCVIRYESDGSAVELQPKIGTHDLSGQVTCRFCGIESYFPSTDQEQPDGKARWIRWVIGLYILFVLFWLIWGGVLLCLKR
jgi:hypothetical protein